MSLKGKVAWITGAGTGIGRAGAEALAAAGAKVVLSGRRREPLDDVAKRIGVAAEVEPLDVSDQAAVRRVADSIHARHGHVDILVNSAGLNFPQRFWADTTPDNFQKVVGINLDGTAYCVFAVLPKMRERRSGLIINVSSWAGRYDAQFTGAAYNASKHGVCALTATINMEEGKNGIRACALCPGEVATPILKNRPVPPSAEEMAKMIQEEDMGRLIRFVAESPEHIVLNEIVVSPTWNRTYLGGSDLKRG
jgi:NAD(P)-dependent dehydrogenase (short-subunit alcohol dehydrogenase family)